MIYFPHSLDYEKMRAKHLQKSTFIILFSSDLSWGKTRQITYVPLLLFNIAQKIFFVCPDSEATHSSVRLLVSKPYTAVLFVVYSTADY